MLLLLVLAVLPMVIHTAMLLLACVVTRAFVRLRVFERGHGRGRRTRRQAMPCQRVCERISCLLGDHGACVSLRSGHKRADIELGRTLGP